MKPAIRLAAVSEVQVIYVFTHDSIGLGEDGPTHEPIEQLAGLRAIPRLYVIRPADPHETSEAWRISILRRKLPTALILTRQKLPVIDRNGVYASATGTRRGAYILAEAEKAGGSNDNKTSGAATANTNSKASTAAPELILIATGSEVSLALAAREQLQKDGVATRVVSMPCCELFDEQPEDYRAQILPPGVTARLAIEAGARLGWDRYVGLNGDVVCLDRFGASAPGDKVMRELGFTPENVATRAKALLKR